MNRTPPAAGRVTSGRNTARLYAGVIVVEVVVLVAIWLFQRHFGS